MTQSVRIHLKWVKYLLPATAPGIQFNQQKVFNVN